MKQVIFYVAILLLVDGQLCFGSVLAVRSENFDTDPGWTVLGSGIGGSNFGYQLSSSFAGGNTGEGGGHFTRQISPYLYADTNLLGVFDLDIAFSASGRLDVTQFQKPDFGRGLVLGHFEQTGLSQIGIVFTDNSTGFGGDLFWGPRIHTGDGSAFFPNDGLSAFDPNIDRLWSYGWDPDGGVHSSGRLTTTLSGPGGGTISLDLNATQRALGGSFDAFGINSRGAVDASSAEFFDLFIDDVTYSTAAIVPEPSTLFIWSLLGGIGLVARHWQLKRKAGRIKYS